MDVLEWRTISTLTRVLFWCLFPFATGEINTKITLEWAKKWFLTRVHTLFHFLHDITNRRMTIKATSFTHRPRVSLAQFSFCWWRSELQWTNNYCGAITSIVISNSLDIDFIHGDIHGRSCQCGIGYFSRYGVSFASLVYILLHSLQCFMEYHPILDRVLKTWCYFSTQVNAPSHIIPGLVQDCNISIAP